MSGKLVALAALAAGVGLLVMHRDAHASSGGVQTPQLPAGWVIPDGAVFLQIPPASNPTKLTLDTWKWSETNPAATPGTWVLVTNHAAPATDYAAFFTPTGTTTPTLVTKGDSANAGLIAQAGVGGLL